MSINDIAVMQQPSTSYLEPSHTLQRFAKCPWGKSGWMDTQAFVDYWHDRVYTAVSPSPATSVLEIGCGDAKILDALRSDVAQNGNVTGKYTGIEIEPELKNEWRSLDPALDLRICDFMTENLEPADRLLLKSVIHLLPNTPKVLDRLYDLTNPGGEICIFHHPDPLPFPQFTAMTEAYEAGRLPPPTLIELAKARFGADNVDVTEGMFKVEITKEAYLDMLAKRYTTPLHGMPQNVLDAGIEAFKNNPKWDDVIEFDDTVIAIKLRKPA